MTLFTARYSLLALFSLASLAVFAQGEDSVIVKKNKQRKSLAITYQAGKLLPSNEFVKGENAAGKPIDYYQSLSMQFAIKTDGRELWQQLYNYPTWGFGLYTFDFFNTDELGSPGAFYGFFSAPFVRFKKWSINYSIGSGISFNWKPFDREENPYNNAIGSPRNGFVDAGVYFNFQLSKHFDLSTGVTLNHSSNGAARVPNLGINMVGARLSLKYIFKGRPEFIEREEIPKYKKKWEFLMIFAYSHKQMAFDTVGADYISGFISQDYNIYNFSIGVNRQLNYKLKLGLGMDFSYDGAYNSFITVENQQIEPQNGEGTKLVIGIYPSFEWVIHRFSVIMQPGWYIYRADPSIPEPTEENNVVEPKRTSSNFYQRIGFKYHILKDMFIGFNVRAYEFDVADYFEWNIGYRFLH